MFPLTLDFDIFASIFAISSPSGPFFQERLRTQVSRDSGCRIAFTARGGGRFLDESVSREVNWPEGPLATVKRVTRSPWRPGSRKVFCRKSRKQAISSSFHCYERLMDPTRSPWRPVSRTFFSRRGLKQAISSSFRCYERPPREPSIGLPHGVAGGSGRREPVRLAVHRIDEDLACVVFTAAVSELHGVMQRLRSTMLTHSSEACSSGARQGLSPEIFRVFRMAFLPSKITLGECKSA